MKKKTLLMTTILIAAVLIWAGTTFAAAPRAYVTYTNPGDNTVIATIYWNDAGGYTNVQYATDMNTNRSDLNWVNTTSTSFGGTNYNRYAVLTTTEYRNYNVKISDATVAEDTYVRLFPVNYVAPGREFNDYAHGNFRPDTPMCGGCHSTHSALKAQLLKKASYYELCMLCHSNANAQSKYDVEAGLVTVAGPTTKASLAGPIKTALGAISIHNADDTGGVTPVNVPGSDVTTGTKKLSLTCVSCHNGHGGTDDNYRLLKKRIYAADGNQLMTDNINYDAFAITAGATSGEELFMARGNTEFCGACHLDFDEGNAWKKGGQYTPVYSSVYMHPVSVGSVVYSVYYNYAVNPNYAAYPNPAYNTGVRTQPLNPTIGDVLPLQYNPDTNEPVTDRRTAVVCSTCHFAHGSTKSFNVQGAVYDGKYMLRLDNYGVCESCHRK